MLRCLRPFPSLKSLNSHTNDWKCCCLAEVSTAAAPKVHRESAPPTPMLTMHKHLVGILGSRPAVFCSVRQYLQTTRLKLAQQRRRVIIIC